MLAHRMVTMIASRLLTGSTAYTHKRYIIAGVGPDPARAMTDINRLRLFPAVFTVPADAEAKLPSNWGEPCVQVLTAATATLAAVKFQVPFAHLHKRLFLCLSLV